MSWQAYVDTNLVGTGNVTKGALFGLNGGQWAISAGWKVTPDEAKKIIAAFTDASAIRAGGLYVAGEKYMTLKADDRSIYGKKGATGVVCVKTGKAVIIAFYDDKIQPGNCVNVVEKLADYLISVSY